jgi:DNA (cytosine-5)-methyltransferase 1
MYQDIDLLVGGTPCQSFSIAGLRRGLNDDRGNLALGYCLLLKELRPKWFVWENVPGVLSSNEGRDFGSILGAMAELGYGFAYRVLDAQFFGVPQRRRRVFLVGRIGDARRAASVLFERTSLFGYSSSRRKSGENVAALTSTGVGTCGADDPRRNQEASIIAFSCKDDGRDASTKSPTVRSMNFDGSHLNGGGQIAVMIEGGIANTLSASAGHLRRILPIEAERLQGLPDDWTLVDFKNKPAVDSRRYRAIGNSMAEPVMRRIGERIHIVEELYG